MQNEILSEWENHPVTQWLRGELTVRLEALTESLQTEAGVNPIEDARKSGMILAIKDFFDIDFEGTS